MKMKIMVIILTLAFPAIVNAAWDSLPDVPDVDLGGAGDVLGDAKDGLNSQQKRIVDAAAKAQNAKASTIANSVFSEPLSSKEAACLDQLLNIDLSIFSVGGAGSIWDAAYKMIMDQIKNLTCAAASDWAKDQTSRVDDMMSDGLDFGEIDDVWSGGTDAAPVTDVGGYVGTSEMGKLPNDATMNAGGEKMRGGESTGSKDSRSLSDKTGEAIEKNIFWGTK